MIRAAVFDFDGVVLESCDIKTRAFALLFEDHPEHVDEIVQLHLAQEGISRFEKFRQIHRDILGLPLTPSQEERLGRRFSEIVFDEMLRCDYVRGAPELLASLSQALPLYVASGTPEDELREIAARRDLAGYFTGIYGTPPTKAEILNRVIQEEDVRPTDLVFVGDATTDLDAAREVGVPMVGRVRDPDQDPFAREGVHTVRDLVELQEQWPDLAADPPPIPARV